MKIAATPQGPSTPVALLTTANAKNLDSATQIAAGPRSPLQAPTLDTAYVEASLRALQNGAAQGVFLNTTTNRLEIASLAVAASGAPLDIDSADIEQQRATRLGGDLQAIVGAERAFTLTGATDAMVAAEFLTIPVDIKVNGWGSGIA